MRKNQPKLPKKRPERDPQRCDYCGYRDGKHGAKCQAVKPQREGGEGSS
jgi:hypothetical protein